MEIAPIKKRLLACVVDISIFAFLFLLIYLILYFQYETFLGDSGSGYRYGVTLPTKSTYLTFLFSWTLFIVSTEFSNGQSIGKRIVKIKVVGQDLRNVTFLDIFIRHLFDIVDITFLIGLFFIATTKKRQRIGDLVGKTIVVSKLTCTQHRFCAIGGDGRNFGN
jgi:uncharacterized RDD family membrane protein YckC